MNSDEQMASIHILHGDGRIDSAGRAATDLASRLSLLASVSTGSTRFGLARRLIEASYGFLARNRHHLARLVRDVEPVRRWRLDP